MMFPGRTEDSSEKSSFFHAPRFLPILSRPELSCHLGSEASESVAISENWGGTMVRKAGLEPACLSAPPPQDGVSANSTSSAQSKQLGTNGLVPYSGKDEAPDCQPRRRIRGRL